MLPPFNCFLDADLGPITLRIAADHVKFHPFTAGDASYHLRPYALKESATISSAHTMNKLCTFDRETVESLFIMWRVTKDPQYRFVDH